MLGPLRVPIKAAEPTEIILNMSFADLFDVFSKRPSSGGSAPKRLTLSFRNRARMRCFELFSYTGFWDEIHRVLTYLHGTPTLCQWKTTPRKADDVVQFLESCNDSHFLDFLECAFKLDIVRYSPHGNTLVADFNEFLKQDDLPYAVTDFVWETRVNGYSHSMMLIASPQVIRKDSEVLYQTAIQPTLKLLQEPNFASANKEFLNALEDFRKGDFGDCLIKCGSAFESVLKIICARKKWNHGATDTASPLLKTVVGNSGMESFFTEPLTLVATMRNRLSTAHGAGLSNRDVTEAKAEYSINATAAAILLVVKEAN